ncbi:MAG: hypothetical protein OSB70_04610 [Myxococcota bacterium]|nr:hypothetical protein [Myxococcota bacterium]
MDPKGHSKSHPKGEARKRVVPRRADYGEGIYRRCIVLKAEEHHVRTELADDFHHFAVALSHDGEHAKRLSGEGIRVPWTTCPGALLPLRRLEGASLDLPLTELARYTDASAQCTHLFDLACLAFVHARRARAGGAATRRYDITLPDRVQGTTRARLERDGLDLLEWKIEGNRIGEASPPSFEGLELSGRPFHRFITHEVDDDLAEAAWVLRRGVFIGGGRIHDFKRVDRGTTFQPVVGAACHTFGPDQVGQALPIHSSLRDFSAGRDKILERPEEG